MPGGGIVAEPLTYDLLLQAFYTVWLRARPEEHMNRVREQGHLPTTGDHASAMQELRAVLASREPLYARAAAQVDTSDIPVPVMLERLTAAIETPAGSSEGIVANPMAEALGYRAKICSNRAASSLLDGPPGTLLPWPGTSTGSSTSMSMWM